MKRHGPRPGMRHHEYWCAIFNGGQLRRQSTRSPDSQATSAIWRSAKTNQEKEREELEEA
jgi:hypothetical protein